MKINGEPLEYTKSEIEMIKIQERRKTIQATIYYLAKWGYLDDDVWSEEDVINRVSLAISEGRDV